MNKIYMSRCPVCNKDNYCMCIHTGTCYFCKHIATEDDLGHRGVWLSNIPEKDKKDEQ